ncbi:MAG: LytR/AlgR family response regulator transcription factor, partial [Flavisolibacter sp.]
ASNGEEAITMINELKPDLVFLDIQMPDLTGFEVLQKLDFQPNIIFITAYEQYAIKAFESYSIDYLLKPIREERLEQSIHKLKAFGRTEIQTDISVIKKMMEELKAPKKPTAFPVKQGDKIILVRFENISHLAANDKFVELYTVDGKKYLVDQTLTSLLERLPETFLRVQKSYILNKERIKEIHKHFNGRFIIIMDDKSQTRITTGLTFYESIREAFGLG